ncbi:MAG: hypothetical protein AAFX39_03585 [Pseudomonadota bacterium]
METLLWLQEFTTTKEGRGTLRLLGFVVNLLSLVALGLAAFALIQGARSLKLRFDANAVSVFTHFSSQYHELMKNIPQAGTNENGTTVDVTSDNIKLWWYRYWDIMIAEYHFMTTGILSEKISELWMSELFLKSDEFPRNNPHMGTFSESYKDRRGTIENIYPEAVKFFDAVVLKDCNGHTTDLQCIRQRVQSLAGSVKSKGRFQA